MTKFYYGGQAVIEGVMMRGRHQATVAVRRRDGSVTTRTELLSPALYGRALWRLPLLRGLVALWEMLFLGTRMMLFSATIQTHGSAEQEVPKRVIRLMLSISVAFVVLVFFVLPLFLARAGGHLVGGSLAGNAMEGATRLLLFIGYLALVGKMQQMRRVFQYHGAEHKTVNAFEAGAPLTPESVQRHSTVHVRCGTAFLLWVVVISIFVFALLGHPALWLSVVDRIVLVPIIAAMSYEILRLGARYYSLTPVRFVLEPGLQLQRLTTREPTNAQVEVAIASLLPVLEADGVTSVRPVESTSSLTPVTVGATR